MLGGVFFFSCCPFPDIVHKHTRDPETMVVSIEKETRQGEKGFEGFDHKKKKIFLVDDEVR